MKKHKLDAQYKKYGITYAQYEEMWDKQGKKCALCGRIREEGRRRFACDHNHSSKKVRAIVCMYCNKYRISRHNLKSATALLEYMEKYDG